MGKLNPISTKYVIQARLEADGLVERPDVIGAIFGQTEGFLGTDLELRELQRSGKVGRIDVNLDTINGKSSGLIYIPCSLDQAEVAIIAATLETIERVGPCNAKIKIEKIEDVRATKRNIVVDRAKELLKQFQSEVLPDSIELTNEVSQGVRVSEVGELGPDKLPVGPDAESSEEVIIVEGRADVLNLLRNGIKNVIGINGTNIPASIGEICKQKIVTVFVDGDRGGDLIIRELMAATKIDFIAKAPDGKEVEELAKKEIHMALRGRTPIGQFKFDTNPVAVRQQKYQENGRHKLEYSNQRTRSNSRDRHEGLQRQQSRRNYNERPRQEYSGARRNKKAESLFKTLLEDLTGTRGAYLVDKELNILGKVPLTELPSTLKELNNVYAVIFDGELTKDLLHAAERNNVEYLVGTNAKVKSSETRLRVLSYGDF
jgi:DNA primase